MNNIIQTALITNQDSDKNPDPLSHREIASHQSSLIDFRLFDTGQSLLRFTGELLSDSPDFCGPPRPCSGEFSLDLRRGDVNFNTLNRGTSWSGEITLDTYPELRPFLNEILELIVQQPSAVSKFLKNSISLFKSSTGARGDEASNTTDITPRRLSSRSPSIPEGSWFNLKKAKREANRNGQLLSEATETLEAETVAIVGPFYYDSSPLSKTRSASVLIVSTTALQAAQPKEYAPSLVETDITSVAYQISFFISDKGLTLHLESFPYELIKLSIEDPATLHFITKEGSFVIPVTQAILDTLARIVPLPLKQSGCGQSLPGYNIKNPDSTPTLPDYSKSESEIRLLLNPVVQFINDSSEENLRRAKTICPNFGLLKLEGGQTANSSQHFLKPIPDELVKLVEFAILLGGQRFLFNSPPQLSIGITPNDACFWVLNSTQVAKL